MRLVKRGGTYSIVYEEAGRQRWMATGLTDRAAAEQRIVKERAKQERILAGLAPATENPNLKVDGAYQGIHEAQAPTFQSPAESAAVTRGFPATDCGLKDREQK
jgi:hypothetical protein